MTRAETFEKDHQSPNGLFCDTHCNLGETHATNCHASSYIEIAEGCKEKFNAQQKIKRCARNGQVQSNVRCHARGALQAPQGCSFRATPRSGENILDRGASPSFAEYQQQQLRNLGRSAFHRKHAAMGKLEANTMPPKEMRLFGREPANFPFLMGDCFGEFLPLPVAASGVSVMMTCGIRRTLIVCEIYYLGPEKEGCGGYVQNQVKKKRKKKMISSINLIY